MATRDLRLIVADALAQEVETAGLLTPRALEALLRAELRRRRLDDLFAAADRLAALDEAPLIAAEIDQEIRAVRRERRGAPARGR